MQFGGINYLAVLVAAIAGWLISGAWYAAFGNAWMKALGVTKEDLVGPSGKPSATPFAIAFVANLITAWALAGVIGHLGPGQVTLWNGIVSGFFIWLGFVATTMTVTYSFSKRSPTLLAIDVLQWLAFLLVQGAVIGLFGVG
jgi:hypothetical protein